MPRPDHSGRKMNTGRSPPGNQARQSMEGMSASGRMCSASVTVGLIVGPATFDESRVQERAAGRNAARRPRERLPARAVVGFERVVAGHRDAVAVVVDAGRQRALYHREAVAEAAQRVVERSCPRPAGRKDVRSPPLLPPRPHRTTAMHHEMRKTPRAITLSGDGSRRRRYDDQRGSSPSSASASTRRRSASLKSSSSRARRCSRCAGASARSANRCSRACA